jgi:MFS superfamily sulfate permease-like transporter
MNLFVFVMGFIFGVIISIFFSCVSEIFKILKQKREILETKYQEDWWKRGEDPPEYQS